MGIHNENNCEAFNEEIDFLIERIKEQCKQGYIQLADGRLFKEVKSD